MTPRGSERPDWFALDDVGEGIWRVTEPCYRPDYRCNIYLVRGSERDIVIDSGLGLASLRAFLRPLSDDPLLICSHSHYDHIGSNWEFSQRLIHASEADVVARPTQANTFADPILRTEDFLALPWPGFQASDWNPPAAPATGYLSEGDVLDLGDRRFQVLATPGHSWGSVCLWDAENQIMMCADTVYQGEIFDFLPCSDIPTYIETMRRLRQFPVRAAFPGHGPILDGADFRTVIDKYLASRS